MRLWMINNEELFKEINYNNYVSKSRWSKLNTKMYIIAVGDPNK